MNEEMKEISVSEYCKKFNIVRHAVHRRIRKFELTNEPVNNIIGVRRIGPKIIVLTINPRIKFKIRQGRQRKKV